MTHAIRRAPAPTLLAAILVGILHLVGGAASAQPAPPSPIGVAKDMTGSTPGQPVTIDYVFENFDMIPIFTLSAVDDLTATFGAAGADWTFTSISSVPAAFANPGFDGSSDPELINQAPTQSLAAGATATITVTIQLLTANGAVGGEFCNQVNFSGEVSANLFVSDDSTPGLDPDPNGDSDPAEQAPTCNALPPGDLDLVKTGALDLGADGVANPGDLINYTFSVTNIGPSPLSNVSITDPMVSPIACPSGNPIPTLIGGANEICTGSYAITQADIDAGSKSNTATASGQEATGAPVSDMDMWTEPIPAVAAIDLVKTGALDLGADGVANPGDLINYTFTVTNTGPSTLANVLVTDPMVSPIACPSGNPIPTLSPGASEACTGSYAITQADIDAGGKTNTATAAGTDPLNNPVSDQDTWDEVIPVPPVPAIAPLGLILLALALVGSATVVLRRRRAIR